MSEYRDPNEAYDPIEDDPAIKKIIDAAEKEAAAGIAAIGKHPQKDELGYCHWLWGAQKSILKEEYGVAGSGLANVHFCFHTYKSRYVKCGDASPIHHSSISAFFSIYNSGASFKRQVTQKKFPTVDQ